MIGPRSNGRTALAAALAMTLTTAFQAAPARAQSFDPSAGAALLAALNGGPGGEFVSLILREVPNYPYVLAGIQNGSITAYNIPGLAIKTPAFQSGFTGTKYDALSITAAGGMLVTPSVLEFGVILRGPNNDPNYSFVSFGVNRGSGLVLPAPFATRAGVRPDAQVVVAVAPGATSAFGAITDFTTGVTTPLQPFQISVSGPTVRVWLFASQLPSKGLALNQYLFTAWTQSSPGGIATVGSFVPENAMIPVGVGY